MKRKIIKSILISSLLLTITNKPFAIELKPGEVLAEKQELRLPGSDLPTVDPNLNYDGASEEIVKNLFEPLIEYNQKEGKYVPLSAESYSVSEDGKVWTFKLKKEVVWSDGKKVTAHDYVFSWQRIVDPKLASPLASYLVDSLHIINAQEIINGKLSPSKLGVKAIDDYTFQVTTDIKVPWFDIAINLSSLSAVPKHVIEKHGDKWTKPENIVVNGPFILNSYIPNGEIVLLKNNKYYNADKVVITKIYYPIIKDLNGPYLRYLSGDLDITGIPKTYLQKVVASGKTIYHNTYLDTFGFTFNLTRKKFQDPKVRKAIRLVIDNKYITDNIIRLNYIPTYNWVPKGIGESELITKPAIESQPIEERIKEAQKLIAEAGYTKDNPLEFDMLYATGPFTKPILVSVQQKLNEVFKGAIKTNLISTEFKIYLDKVYIRHDYDFASFGWYYDFDNASNFLSIFLSTSSSSPTGYKSKEYDDLFNQLLVVKTSEERQLINKQLNDIIVNENIVIPVYTSVSNTLLNPKLKGIYFNGKPNRVKNFYFIK